MIMNVVLVDGLFVQVVVHANNLDVLKEKIKRKCATSVPKINLTE